ncbi:MAG TPA: hypothetical protein EYG99_01110 [Candidatus Pacebacteria bacterium]|nr:hypothetical protein [Candidatus Paceibacterota bacterium]
MKKTKKNIGDSVIVKKQREYKQKLSILHEVIENNHNKNIQTLLLSGERTEFFVTEDSRKYISKEQQYKIDAKYDYIDPRGYFDSLHVRYVRSYSAEELQQRHVVAEFRSARDIVMSFRIALKLDLSPIRMWQVSLAGAVLFGMISMNMIYKNLGQSAMAKGDEKALLESGEAIELVVNEKVETEIVQEETQKKVQKKVQKTERKKQDIKNVDKKESLEQKSEDKIEKVKVDSVQKSISVEDEMYDDSVEEKVKKTVNEDKKVKVDSVQEKQDEKTEDKAVEEYSLEHQAREIVKGYPIEKMLPYILQQDPEVAKYLIAIAKQESQWGKRVPVLNGQDCYNYWGFRSKRKLMGSGGHTCFNSRKDAVETVGRRIHELIYKYDRKTADRLIVWKCGSSCAGHSQAGVDRWIDTVGYYYSQLSE